MLETQCDKPVKLLWHRRQLGHTQRQPLGAVAREVDLRAGVVARTFQREHRALAKLGVEHLHAQAQTMGGLCLACNILARRAGSCRRTCVACS